MSRALQTVVGLALIATDIALLLLGRVHADWLHLGLVGIGGFFVSKSLMLELVKAAVGAVVSVRKP